MRVMNQPAAEQVARQLQKHDSLTNTIKGDLISFIKNYFILQLKIKMRHTPLDQLVHYFTTLCCVVLKNEAL